MSTDRGTVLLRIARSAIEGAFGATSYVSDPAPWLAEPGAVFVTLTQNGGLRGCIGSLEAHRPVGEDCRENALAAAFRDPRFPALRAAELPVTRVEVSLLSAPAPLRFTTEAEALAALRPGVDGVVFECGRRRSTFLPQVWEQLPDVATFMAHLKQKAGFAPDFWAPEVRLARYTVEKWKEPAAGQVPA